nr:hypothetical protein Iba_chr11aCG18110 [Ipomoea batatas]GMD53118.1 hypothetical protein Iba_chr11bCG18090 [Ipomoea batatas]
MKFDLSSTLHFGISKLTTTNTTPSLIGVPPRRAGTWKRSLFSLSNSRCLRLIIGILQRPNVPELTVGAEKMIGRALGVAMLISHLEQLAI